MNNIEIRKVDIPSPIEFNIGDDYLYKGQYINGYEEGISKVIRIYKEITLIDGIVKKVRKDEDGGNPIWMELDNGKLILLGFLEYKDQFKIADSFK